MQTSWHAILLRALGWFPQVCTVKARDLQGGTASQEKDRN